jgi:hypothetical protein
MQNRKRKGKMAFSYKNSKGQTYYLHNKMVTLKNGITRPIYFFARDVREGAVDAVPAGYEVVETQRTGMPVLRRIRPAA